MSATTIPIIIKNAASSRNENYDQQTAAMPIKPGAAATVATATRKPFVDHVVNSHKPSIAATSLKASELTLLNNSGSHHHVDDDDDDLINYDVCSYKEIVDNFEDISPWVGSTDRLAAAELLFKILNSFLDYRNNEDDQMMIKSPMLFDDGISSSSFVLPPQQQLINDDESFNCYYGDGGDQVREDDCDYDPLLPPAVDLDTDDDLDDDDDA